jgi:hypothetical protein
MNGKSDVQGIDNKSTGIFERDDFNTVSEPVPIVQSSMKFSYPTISAID